MFEYRLNRRTILKSSTVGLFASSIKFSQSALASRSISYGDTVTGVISEESPLSGENDPFVGHYEWYSFAVDSGEDFYVELTPEEPAEDSAELHLFNSEGTLVNWSIDQEGPQGRAFLTHGLDERDDTEEFTVAATIAESRRGSESNAVPSENRLELNREGGSPPEIDEDVWEAVTDQNDPPEELVTEDIEDGIDAYRNTEPVNGVELELQDMIDLIEWYQG